MTKIPTGVVGLMLSAAGAAQATSYNPDGTIDECLSIHTTSPQPCNAAASSGSNQGPTSYKEIRRAGTSACWASRASMC